MEKIKEYLEQEERDYRQGVALLAKHTKNRNLAINLGKKENSSNRQKLEYELAKLADVKAAPKAAPAVPAAAPLQPAPKPEKQPAPFTGSTDPDYTDLVATMGSLYTQRCQLSNTLADQETDEQRKVVVDQITELQSSYNALAVKKKFFEEHGKFPEVKSEQPQEQNPQLDKAELLKKRNNLRSQVSKARTALAKKPDDATRQEKLHKLVLELDQVELHLKYIADQDKRADETQAE